MLKMEKSSYRNWLSLVMETENIRVEVVPELGAKIVSLISKQTGKEWLVDEGHRDLVKRPYGSSFGEADMSGWDEVFPTIDPCVVDSYDGQTLPDHGEVWPLSWNYEVNDSSISCLVEGVARPYLLTRTLRFVGADVLQLDYQVENPGKEALPFLWVPHPQFWVAEPTRIVLPSSVQELLCVYGVKRHKADEIYPWNELALVGDRQTGDGRKYYLQGPQQEGWCGLVGEHSGDWLRMDYDPIKVPYFGVWIDEGLGNDRNVITLEPSIGYYDSLERAIANGTAQTVEPGQAWEWSLRIRLGSGGVDSGFDLGDG